MKKGYTLVELIIVMAILIILLVPTLNLAKSYKTTINRIKGKSVINDLSNLISFSKHYCRHNKVIGKIEVNKIGGEAIFKDMSGRGKVIKCIYLPEGFVFKTVNLLNVTTEGYIQSDTIRFLDNDKNAYKLTISTGIDTVNIYEGE